MKMIRTFWGLLIVGILMVSCNKKHNELNIKITKQKAGYGYRIEKGKRTIIDQPYIPAIQGEQNFRDSIQAKKTAELILNKIKRSSFPRISKDELDSMKIEYEIPKFQ